jgi:hypothetical protein
MKKTRWIIIFLFVTILICVFAVILPQQSQKEGVPKTQTAGIRQATKAAGLTEAAMTAESPLTSLKQACEQHGAHAAVSGRLALNLIAVTGKSKINVLSISQEGVEAGLDSVLICSPSIKKSCMERLPDNYSAADFKGFDVDGNELAIGDLVTVFGVVDLSSGGCHLNFTTIKKVEP